MYSQPLGNHKLQIFWWYLLVVSDLTLDQSFKVKLWRVNVKVVLSRLFLVLQVSNVQSTFRKPYAVNLLVMSDFTLDLSFKVKLV